MITTLKLFGRGQITLPKKWRSKHNTDQYVAIETSQGLLIQPLEPVIFYDKDNEAGLTFPLGINAKELREELTRASGKISKVSK